MSNESWDDFLARLGPKAAKGLKTADKLELNYYPTGSIQLNHALGGGIGANRITLVYGNYSAGKTMLALSTIAELQKQGKVCGFIDVEKSLTGDYAEALGVDISRLAVAQVTLASQIEETCAEWFKAGMHFVVVDSTSAMMPDVFMDKQGKDLKDYGDRGQIGADSVALKRLIRGLHFHMTDETAVMLLSQTTTEIGQTYVKQVPTGGKAPGFYSSTVIKLQSSDNDKEQIKGFVRKGDVEIEENIGRKVEATITKNKVNGRQSRKCKYDIYYGGDSIGIDNVGELIDLAIDYDIVVQAGAWMKYKEETWNGRKKLLEAVKMDHDLFNRIKTDLDAKMEYDTEEDALVTDEEEV